MRRREKTRQDSIKECIIENAEYIVPRRLWDLYTYQRVPVHVAQLGEGPNFIDVNAHDIIKRRNELNISEV